MTRELYYPFSTVFSAPCHSRSRSSGNAGTQRFNCPVTGGVSWTSSRRRSLGTGRNAEGRQVSETTIPQTSRVNVYEGIAGTRNVARQIAGDHDLCSKSEPSAIVAEEPTSLRGGWRSATRGLASAGASQWRDRGGELARGAPTCANSDPPLLSWRELRGDSLVITSCARNGPFNLRVAAIVARIAGFVNMPVNTLKPARRSTRAERTTGAAACPSEGLAVFIGAAGRLRAASSCACAAAGTGQNDENSRTETDLRSFCLCDREPITSYSC